MRRLTDTMGRLQAAERKAFGIADDHTGASPLDSMSTAELEAEIARLAADRGVTA